MKLRVHKGRASVRQAFSDVADAIRYLKSVEKDKDKSQKARSLGMALNYVGMILKSLGLQKQAKIIMGIGADLADGTISVKGEVEGQTPAQEEQLKGLGWTEHDIDNMSARQIEIILKKKTRRRRADVMGGNTPEQIRDLLTKRGKAVDELYGFLKERDHTKYVIGDFFKGDLPKLRTLSEQLLKRKKDLELTIYKYRQQLAKDLKEADKNARA